MESLMDCIPQQILQSADISLAIIGKKQATATEGFDVYISYL
jgi:hypothetical protein